MTSETRQFHVTGRVQGVAFRAFVRDTAVALGLRGHVRNLADGRVEAVASGSAPALERFAARLARGPAGARVDAIDAVPAGETPANDRFEIRWSG